MESSYADDHQRASSQPFLSLMGQACDLVVETGLEMDVITKEDVEHMFPLGYDSVPSHIRDEAWKTMRRQLKKRDGRPENAQQAEKWFKVTDGKGNECFSVWGWFRDVLPYQAWALELLERRKQETAATIVADRRHMARKQATKKRVMAVPASRSRGAHPVLNTTAVIDESQPQLGGANRPRRDIIGTNAGKSTSPVLPLPQRRVPISGVIGTYAHDVVAEYPISAARRAASSVQPLAACHPSTTTITGADEQRGDCMYSAKAVESKKKSNQQQFSSTATAAEKPLSPREIRRAALAYEATIYNGLPDEQPPFLPGQRGRWVETFDYDSSDADV